MLNILHVYIIGLEKEQMEKVMPLSTEETIKLLLKTNKEQEETIANLRATIDEMRTTIVNLNETLDELKRKLFGSSRERTKKQVPKKLCQRMKQANRKP